MVLSNGTTRMTKPPMDIMKETKFHIYALIIKLSSNGAYLEQIRTLFRSSTIKR